MGKRKRSGSFSKYDDYSKKSDDGDSQEELDGESAAIQKGNSVNGIRYSARVQEKQEKLRREASPSKQIVADSTFAPTVVAPTQSCSNVQKPVTGGNGGGEEPLFCALPFSSHDYILHSVPSSGSEKKKKRTWELWSQEDKQLFFEALNEFGKDFDAIQNYLASKLKPRSKASCAQAVPKNKDQVRHFYYRTWNKISKYLTFPKDMKKAYQELYGLINYGELRKKQRVLNLKTAVKLSELVERGTSTIKVRGKTFRIKTPVCRALKKLNQLDDVDHIRVPCKLCVELIPRDGSTWSSVQRVSHNPRVKVYVPLQRTLSSLISYFEERWKTDHNRLKEEFSLTIFGKPRTRLRFIPVEGRDLSIPVFKFSEATSATKICLSSYVQNCLHQTHKDESPLSSKKFKRKSKLEFDSGNRGDLDYFAAEADVSDADGCDPAPENPFRITLRRDKFPLCGPNSSIGNSSSKIIDTGLDQDNSNGFQDNMWSVHEENANAATETDFGETDYGCDENAPSPTECDYNTCDDEDYNFQDGDVKDEKQGTCAACKSPDVDECGTPEKSDKHCTCGSKKESVVTYPSLDIETITRGWNVEEAGALTVGEVYLMLGKCDKLCFEYIWDKCEEDKLREERARTLVEKLVSVARHLKKRKTNRAKTGAGVNVPCSVPSAVSSFSSSLCCKCGNKSDLVMTNTEIDAPTTSLVSSTSKDLCESTHTDSLPKLTLPQQTTQPNQNDISSSVSPEVTAPSTEPAQKENNCVSATPSSSSAVVVETSDCSSNSTPEKQPILCESLDVVTEVSEEVVTAASNLLGIGMTDSIISSSRSDSSILSSSTPIPVTMPPSLPRPHQGGLIELTTIATNSPTNVEIDSDYRRRIAAASNITATILPPPPPVFCTVALSSPALQTVQKPTLTGSLTPVATTTVLVSEPIMCAALAPAVTSFVAIQPCSSTTAAVSSTTTKIAPKPFDGKFRRPDDVPPIMPKPTVIDSSSMAMNEDGSLKVNVPKPFLDLPKGNRRIGRRPAWKQRVIIPRMLPLLPKPETTMATATIIALPPVVATGLSVVPVSSETIIPMAVTSTELDISQSSTVGTNMTVSVASISTPSCSTDPNPTNNPTPTSTSNLGLNASAPSGGATASPSMKNILVDSTKETGPPPQKFSSFAKKNLDFNSGTTSSSRLAAPGLDETLDNISLSSFMDISIPESTRMLASDLRLDELECSNNSNSVSLSGIFDELSSDRKRDPPLLDTPKKRSDGNDDSQITIPSPQRLTPMDTAWPHINENAGDLFMGGLFSSSETLRPAPNEPVPEGDLNFQTVMGGENSLDFESKLNDFAVHITDSNKN